ncbi:hypothetical protein [Nocardia sp. XZ_19_369]|uniref:hypothetical protein n=1 Tax=Nocardia sp. XZ_19_369 TaxID=2769487 RepID=UPI0018901B8F|nr:hypothetical protein [Nocardia sp. XZ_19_369]
MRLFERINRRGVTLRPMAKPHDRPLTFHDVRQAVRRSVRVIADDCAAWCAEAPEQWRSTPSHNPLDKVGPLRLPFDSMWIEWVYPKSPHSDGTNFAAWVTADDPQPYEHAPPGTVQIVNSVLFTGQKSAVRYSPVEVTMAVDAHGTCIGLDSFGAYDSAYTDYTFGALIPQIAAIGFMNCRNVEVADSGESERVRQPGKRTKHSAQRLEPLRHHTIVLPTRGHLRTIASAQAVSGGPAALHKVRGHFKTYRPDAPLLGRHIGTYWWHDAVRGLREQGVIEASYRVGPSERAAR